MDRSNQSFRRRSTYLDNNVTNEISIPKSLKDNEDSQPMQEDASKKELSEGSDGWSDTNEEVLENSASEKANKRGLFEEVRQLRRRHDEVYE